MVSTAFTYQGRLTDSGSPANGTYDLRFSLFDDAGAGAQVGSTQSLEDVAVADGYFTHPTDNRTPVQVAEACPQRGPLAVGAAGEVRAVRTIVLTSGRF